MTDEQKANMAAARVAEANVLVVDMDVDQLEVATVLGFDKEKLNAIARNSFASALRGSLQASIDKTIKAKYLAVQKNKSVLAEECEKAIVEGMKLKNRIS